MATLREQIATNMLTVTKFRELLRRMRDNRPNDDLELVRKAYEFSQKHHSGQQRASGEPYLVHPLEVALVLSEMKMDSVAVAAGSPPHLPGPHNNVAAGESTCPTGAATAASEDAARRRAREATGGRAFGEGPARGDLAR